MLTVIKSDTGEDVFEYEAFEKFCKQLYEDLKNITPPVRIGMPLIGCGLAGGNKERILSIIEKYLSKLNITIVEYQP